MKENYKNWLFLQPWETKTKPLCPECNKETIEYRIIGDVTTSIGWGLVWCRNCHKGIHISRMGVPKNTKIISFAEAEERNDIWPNYNIDLVQP